MEKITDIKKKLLPVIIMAGGKGTRLRDINHTLPKPMLPLLGKPVLEYQLDCLKKQGYTTIILVIGHLGEQIQSYFGDGKRFGVEISYFHEKEPLGTAGALYFLKDHIDEDFLLINGDIIFDIDLKGFEKQHKKNRGLASLLTHPNDHPYDSSIIVADHNKKITDWINKEDQRTWVKNRVNAGLHLLSKEILKPLIKAQKLDLDRDILKPMIPTGKLFVFDSPEYVKDMGTPKRYQAIIKDLQEGKPQQRNLKNKQKAIFLDRDGTINALNGFISNQKAFNLIDGSIEAIKKINQSDYLAIVITNQPVIARGECSLSELETIHNKMESLLGEKGAYIDDLFYCPHHPDKGYEGEISAYKIQCDCRKPKPGLLVRAAQKYNIDLKKSVMIGDDIKDSQAGKAAGCRSILLGKNEKDTETYPNLLACIQSILV